MSFDSSTPNERKSRFIVNYRLRSEQSFAGLEYQFSTVGEHGYRFTFRGNMLWVEFDAYSTDVLSEMNKAEEMLRDVLAILSFQVKHPLLDFDMLSYIEDKPRDTVDARNYGLGLVKPPDEPPRVTDSAFKHGNHITQLADRAPHFRRAIYDYSNSLSLPREAILFCARSVEWVKIYFKNRNLMRGSLCLPAKYLNLFFKLANNTVIARHAGSPDKVRPPQLNEIEFSVVFTREVVLERFQYYLWYTLSSEEDPTQLEPPEDTRPPSELFKAGNPYWTEKLRMILNKNYPGLSYV